VSRGWAAALVRFGRWGLLLAAVVAVAIGASASSPERATARGGLEIGLQDDGVFLDHRYFSRTKALDRAKQLKVTYIRVLAHWSWSIPYGKGKPKKKPPRVDYLFPRMDDLVDQAAKRGIRVELVLTGPAPAWAAANHRVGADRPRATQFAEFARRAAIHFRGRVHRYSIWNEGNYKSWLQPMSQSGTIYRKLYVAGYRAIKNVDPTAAVLIGETSPYALRGRAISPLSFLRQLACVSKSYKLSNGCVKKAPGPGGGPLLADGYAHHPYDRHSPTYNYPGSDNVTIGTLGRLTSALDRLRKAGALTTPGGGSMPVFLTEFAYAAKGKTAVKESTRAKYYKQAFQIALKNPRVAQLCQYALVIPPRKNGGYPNATGIVALNNKPLPTFNALASWAAKADGNGKIDAPGGPITLQPRHYP